MNDMKKQWLESILHENERFRNRISPNMLPVERTPGSLAVITCMDPRVNLEAIGISGFSHNGNSGASVRIIRSIGAMAEHRSLLIGIFLAGIREFVVLMHTDCGCCLAYSKIDTIIENMNNALTRSQFNASKAMIGEPFRQKLIDWAKAFEDPRVAITKEIASIKSLPFVPDDIICHGLLYELESGNIEIVVNGYSN